VAQIIKHIHRHKLTYQDTVCHKLVFVYKIRKSASESVYLPHLFLITALYKLYVASEINCIDMHWRTRVCALQIHVHTIEIIAYIITLYATEISVCSHGINEIQNCGTPKIYREKN
jgi:hypothetical protein